MSFLRRPSRQVIVGSLLLLTAIASHAEAAQLQLAWTDNSQDEDGFKIERSTGTTGTFAQIGVTGPDITTHTDSGLANDTTYCIEYGHSTRPAIRIIPTRPVAQPPGLLPSQ